MEQTPSLHLGGRWFWQSWVIKLDATGVFPSISNEDDRPSLVLCFAVFKPARLAAVRRCESIMNSRMFLNFRHGARVANLGQSRALALARCASICSGS